jgi:hypothetical protein
MKSFNEILKLYRLQELERPKQNPPKCLWLIDSKSKIYTLNGYHFHGGFIKDNPELFDFSNEEEKNIEKQYSDNPEILQILVLRKNWATVRSDGLSLDFCTSKKNRRFRNQVLDFLLDICSKHKIVGASINSVDADNPNGYSSMRTKYYSLDDLYEGNFLYENLRIVKFNKL